MGDPYAAMKAKSKRTSRRSSAPPPPRPARAKRGASATKTAAAVVAMAAMPLVEGCAGPLPPIPVPRLDEVPAVPAWYPEGWQGKDSSRIFIEGKIVFETDKSIILPESEKVLQKLLAFVNEHPEITRLRIEGHTDSRADDEYNLHLSARRSLAVCDWLVDHGIDHMRLIAVGFGRTRPIAPNDLVEGRAENRRTEFHVAEVNGRLFQNRDPTNGGYVLDVMSLAERRLAKERLAVPRALPQKKAFKPTGNETHDVAAPVAPKDAEVKDEG
jgi:outer membrane protein OmpA-like peptidoglycan-associated protein